MILRGGSWYDAAQCVRLAYRNAIHPDFRLGNLGFRCIVRKINLVVRGGGWAGGARSVRRHAYPPSGWGDDLGFRCVVKEKSK